MTSETRQLFARHHTRVIAQAEAALRKTNCPVTRARLNFLIDQNEAAINRLNREALTADLTRRK